MASYNKVLLMGNLTRDPELRYLPSGMPVVSLGLAVNRRWKNPQGETQEETTFVDCEAFARTAEVLNQYLRKGRPLFVEGRLKLDQWQDQQGNPRSRMKVIVESFNFIDSRQGGEGGEGGGGGDYQGGRSDYQGGGQGGGGYPARGPAAASGGGRGGYNAPAQRPAPPSAGSASTYNAPSAGYNAPPQDVPDHVAPDDSDIPF